MKKIFNKLRNNKIKAAILVICGLVIIFGLAKIFVPYVLEQQESTKVVDRYGKILYDVRSDYRQTNYQNLNDIPNNLIDFLIKKEDKRFYSHFGVDFWALGRAFWISVSGQGVQGGSTIDQQVIKLSKGSFTRTITNKIDEILLAWNINTYYTKQDILLYYINNIYFPKGVRGFKTSCNIYFGTECEDLSMGHYIYLYAKSRFPYKKSITEYSFKIAKYFGYSGYDEVFFDKLEQQEGFWTTNKARHYVNYVLGKQLDNGQDVKSIQTSFDSVLYDDIQDILDQHRSYFQTQDLVDMCVIVLENSSIASMNILQKYGLSGSYINGCTIKRQVGSAIKPFLYTLVFNELGYNQDTVIKDEAVSFASLYGEYAPQNFDLKYHGDVTLGQALGSSLNVPAIKLSNEVGISKLYSFLSEVGKIVGTQEKRDDDINHFGLALALGVKEITPLDFTKMWQIFSPTFCSSAGGQYQSRQAFCEKYASNIEQVRFILSQNYLRLLSFPQDNWFDIAGSYAKSGTSRHFVDGWVCGGKGNKTVCIRAGNYSNKPMRDSGYSTVGPIRYNVLGLF